MSGRSSQDKRKRDQRSVDMSGTGAPPAAPEPWSPPPPEECEPSVTYTLPPPGADESRERIKLRTVTHAETQMFAEFAVIQQTRFRGRWRDVAAADSCHGDEVHLHRYSRSADNRVGDAEHICPVSSLDDLQDGYNQAYDLVVANWSENRRRWHDG